MSIKYDMEGLLLKWACDVEEGKKSLGDAESLIRSHHTKATTEEAPAKDSVSLTKFLFIKGFDIFCRNEMLLARSHIAEILGVSRVAYYQWLKGASGLRPKNYCKIYATYGKLAAMHEAGWPYKGIRSLTDKGRLKKFIRIWSKIENV